MSLFLSPHKYLVPVVLVVVIAIASAGGRFIAGSGTTWTLLAGVMLAALNASLAGNWPALNQLGASYRRFLRGGGAFTVLSAALLTAATSVAAHVKLLHNPWYSLFDVFLITRGPAPFIDTNGEPYVVPGAGHSVSTVLLSAALTFTFFAAAGLTGVAMGLAGKRFSSAAILVGSACVAGLGAGFALGSVSPSAGVLSAIGIALAAMALGSAWVLARTPRATT
ncbi:hypothetical protein [Corynebacterium sp. LK2510]|uniref:hypothetical protein n=1 Tax=Corynebacterium sp. LK2510 TaxID=3110472 RepID=UPI0034CFA4D4